MKSHTRAISQMDVVCQASNSDKSPLSSRLRSSFYPKESGKTERGGSVENLRINLKINLNKKFQVRGDSSTATTLRSSTGTKFANL